MVCFGLFDKKWNVFFASSSAIINPTTLQIGTTHEYTVWRQILLVACKWHYCCRVWALHGVSSGVPLGALLVVLQQWLLVGSVRRTFLVG